MKLCVVIPCFNHSAAVAAVARSAQAYCPVLIVDDGSTTPLQELPGCSVVRLDRNRGKGAALRVGFQRAAELGFSHVITLDADGQHFAEDIPKFLAAAQAQPDALVVGVRDFYASACPQARRRANSVSSFWFRVETGVRLGDSQCGFRCYPLALIQRLKTRSGRYAFELEVLIRSAWLGAPIVAVPVKCVYKPEHVSRSHFRPVRDFAHISIMNLGLVLERARKSLTNLVMPGNLKPVICAFLPSIMERNESASPSAMKRPRLLSRLITFPLNPRRRY